MASKRPTMADVAKASGVSTALVSIVFRGAPGASEATRLLVKEKAAELGYTPDRRAQKLRQHHSGLIGVAFEIDQAFHGDIVEKLYPAAKAHGFELQLSAITPTRPEKDAVDALIKERCEAVILLGSRMSPQELEVFAKQLPVQVIARESGTPQASSVHVDDAVGAQLALDHLIELGHKNIIYIDGGDAAGTQLRSKVFKDHIDSFSGTCHIIAGGSNEAAGARAMSDILDAGTDATAIIAFNDRVALGVLDVLWQRGVKVPEEISVVGYDNSRLASLEHISLTTIAQDSEALAEKALEIALKQIKDHEQSTEVLAPQLIKRGTTGRKN
ncbi:transcriptional regulator [Corynebacterium suranareeae]|uniref:Transcriptional regulator n=1 Tax=Corynebacterium suranareeae TaxID=2506452 RepID=A0A160PRY3_9CORY|nr:LacI family DNA-binding transcriptional regulator [Corynebacterium suranareeae]BAU96446.1 transcriptional regulator [Corynebacterium suranareeae]